MRTDVNTPNSGFLLIARHVIKQGYGDLMAPHCYLIPRRYPLPRASLLSLHLHLALRLAYSPPLWCSYWQLLQSLLPSEWITTEHLWKATQKLQLAQCGVVHLPKGTGHAKPGTPALHSLPWLPHHFSDIQGAVLNAHAWNCSIGDCLLPLQTITAGGCWSAKNSPKQGVKVRAFSEECASPPGLTKQTFLRSGTQWKSHLFS